MQVCQTPLVIQVVQATDIEDQVERHDKPIKAGDILQAEINIQVKLAYFSPGKVNGSEGKVNGGNMPAMTGKVDGVGAGAAPEIQGSTWRMRVYVFN